MEPVSGAAGDQETQNKPRHRDVPEHEKEEVRRRTREAYEAMVAEGLKIEAAVLEQRKLVPASTMAMGKLPSPRVGDAREGYCHVCHDDFEEVGKLRMMPCAHAFHQHCIFSRLHVNSVCPVCGYEIMGNEEAILLAREAHARES
ncbi:hypothetical protein ACQ4PT_060121 [Festuca glaucescens]